jgi:hypothetical protein
MQRLSGSATDTGISVELVLWHGFTHLLLPLGTTTALQKVVALKYGILSNWLGDMLSPYPSNFLAV